jgi:hypothetical protein
MILFIGKNKNITMGSKGCSDVLRAPEPKRYVSRNRE